MQHFGQLFIVVLAFALAACGPNETSETSQETALAVESPEGKSFAVIREMCEGRNGLDIAEGRQWSSVAHARAAATIQCDAYDIVAHIRSATLPDQEARRLSDRALEAARLALEVVSTQPVDSSRLPLSQPHQQMFEFAAEAERASGSPSLGVWPTNPWKPLHPLARAPANTSDVLETALMRGEHRVLAFNVRNFSAQAQTLRIYFSLPAIPSDALQISRVNWTGNDRSSWAAAEIEPLGDASAVREMMLLPGITQQVWIEVSPPRSMGAGEFVGRIELTTGNDVEIDLPILVTIFKTQFPTRPSMHFGGWDYADVGTDPRYAVTHTNRPDIIQHLQARFVDTPWGHRQVLHWNNLDAHPTTWHPLDTRALEQWISEWPSARRFRVFLGVHEDIAGIDVSDDRFAQAVATWAQAWAAEIRRLNKSPDQFDLLLQDEPDTPEEARITEAWARAIRQSGAGLRIWVDPIWQDPRMTPQSLIDAVDTVAINLSVAEKAGGAYWDWARELSRQGKTIEIYACEGPARRLDPYGYYRLTAWRASFIGAAAVSFWSFSDSGGSGSENEFAAGGVNYVPFFISNGYVKPGKHMEAAVEGIEDAEYLEMLRVVAKTHTSPATRLRANELLEQASNIISKSPPSSNSWWRSQLVSYEIERHRIEIGQFLDSQVP